MLRIWNLNREDLIDYEKAQYVLKDYNALVKLGERLVGEDEEVGCQDFRGKEPTCECENGTLDHFIRGESSIVVCYRCNTVVYPGVVEGREGESGDGVLPLLVLSQKLRIQPFQAVSSTTTSTLDTSAIE